MSANRSTAVMQRRKVAPDSLNYFPTPPFATRALCEWLAGALGDLSNLSVWEPGCGELHMARPLAESFATVRASDVHRYSPDHELMDFVMFGPEEPPADFVITNPPFQLAQAFIETGLKVARRGVAMLVRSAFLEGGGRYTDLWSISPPSDVLQFCERVVMLEGRLIRSGALDPFAEKAGNKATTATSYVWLVWLKAEDHFPGDRETRFHWIAPCRERLERPGDYPDYGIGKAAPAGALL
jgi:hypothetical protein